MKWQALIFDLDGVLVDSEGVQMKGWQIVLKPFGIKLGKKQYFDYAGKSGLEIAQGLIERFSLPVEAGGLVAEKQSLMMRLFRKSLLPPNRFAKKAVLWAGQAGLKTAVCTTGPKEQTMLKLEKSGLKKYFKVIKTIEDVKKGKPSPDIYLKTAEALCLEPKNCVAIEDTWVGVKAAKAAGMACIAMPNEFSEKQDFSEADTVCKSLKEAINWIKSQ